MQRIFVKRTLASMNYNKNYPNYPYVNPGGPVETVMVGPRRRGPQVYDRTIHDPRSKKF